ncbi:tRNA uracil 4-sulfurtransferase ThiI [Alkalicoccus halolimnae]|uniref:Probable tRNA sulfurtransferase n=1 Tax=Alkalicoccus halolimnae TaxID=1667239 RepID=A0A5C7FLU5_9BACI|nr:tRNA uracil 4-sulfurtransferase ThiI [Alkalicoccus halolimnae]TXF85715.1 tRNA 4-thiouridine(8) synthase ThiI [Alkalicoccus halolimnae]
MMYDLILVRYAELSVKGKNRKKFERQLEMNIRRSLKSYPRAKTFRTFGRMYVELNGEPFKDVSEVLKDTFGISSFSPVVRTELQEQKIFEAAYRVTADSLKGRGGSFKVSVRRINKSFPTGSQEMNQQTGSYVLQRIENLSVNVRRPDVEVHVEIRDDAAYISGEIIRGAGGFPVGTSGRALLLLSGGIDSPVAGFLAMKRGVTLEAIHFHSPPYTNEQARRKVEDLGNILAKFGGRVRLHIVPFTKTQLAIHKQIPDNCEITVMRRFMLRIAEETARRSSIKALINGESLGQVASQTLESMYAINEVTSMPLLRPLITMDKLEVVDLAKKICTYETSILPYEDCCTIFLPPDAKTRPKLEKIQFYESFLEIDEYVNEAVSGIETIELTGKSGEREKFEELL